MIKINIKQFSKKKTTNNKNIIRLDVKLIKEK
jgi:hypothetical protein